MKLVSLFRTLERSFQELLSASSVLKRNNPVFFLRQTQAVGPALPLQWEQRLVTARSISRVTNTFQPHFPSSATFDW